MPDTETGPVTQWDATVTEHKQRQLLRIGQVAVDLVTDQGISATSMSALARTVGISRATLYNYVPDVATAIHLYLTAHAEDFYDAVAAAVAEETGPEAQLRRYISEQVAYAAGHDHRTASALAAIGATAAKPDSVTAHEKRHPEVLERILEDGIHTGVFRPAPAGTHATMINRLLYSAPELLDEHRLSQTEAAATITNFVFGGISAANTHASAHTRPRRARPAAHDTAT